MKIIVSPAKELDLSQPLDQDWQLSPASQKLVRQAKTLTKSDLAQVLQVQGQLLETQLAYQAGMDQARTYRAIDLYHGLAFRHMDYQGLDKAGQAYLDDHLKILSALYGPIGPQARIKPYRLDLTSKLKVEGQSLKAYWADRIGEVFRPGETLFNLASKEFSSLLRPEDYHWIGFDFYRVDEAGRKKRHSSLAKKARGAMVHYLAQNLVNQPSQAKAFDWQGYRFDPEASTDHLLAFRQEA